MSIFYFKVSIIRSIFVLFAISVLFLLFSYHRLMLVHPINQWQCKKSIPIVDVFTQEGDLIAEFKPRQFYFVPFDKVPVLLIKAFIATEDQRFWTHFGIDFFALLRAGIELLTTRQKTQGGSTITMQVVRNLYLTPQKTFLRKFKEILFAVKLEQQLTKQKILEIYLNKVYMGQGLSGIGAAADFYFKKSLNQLNLAEIALLAGLPKAPSLINPMTNLKAAWQRRNFVLYRMYQMHFIDKKTYQNAIQQPVNFQILNTVRHPTLAPYVANMAQDQANHLLNTTRTIKKIKVYTTISTPMQKIAEHAIQKNLLDYDQRHGYQGPEQHIGILTTQNLPTLLHVLKNIPVIHKMIPALVIETSQKNILALLANGLFIKIQNSVWGELTALKQNTIQQGDMIRVLQYENQWILTQVPKVEAALVALDPKTGAIKSLSGGLSYVRSQFNRAIHATRQPGSAFKPFIYAAALEKGYTLADTFNNAPLVFYTQDQTIFWRPQNVTLHFSGLTRLRVALVDSINLVTVRLLQSVGIQYTLNYVERFGFQTKKWKRNLTLALGSQEVSPLQLAQGYAVFANGGYRITPYLITHITNEEGQLLYQAKPYIVRVESKAVNNSMAFLQPAEQQKAAPRVISKEVAFLINSALQDVTKYGTAQKFSQILQRADLAGKTGTTNDKVDSLFIGYNQDLVTSTWVGYDQPRSLKEYAYSLGVPLCTQFMEGALKDKPERVFVPPDTIRRFYIDPVTGKQVLEKTPGAIEEYFHTKHPRHLSPVISSVLQKDVKNTDETQHPLF